MITLRIGESEHPIDTASPSWIAEQLSRQSTNGITPCVVIRISEGDIHLALPGVNCPKGGGAGKPPTSAEQEIIDLWKDKNLHTNDFSAGHLVSFMEKLKRVF